jgi:uncharacterized protein with FMN-binding domain
MKRRMPKWLKITVIAAAILVLAAAGAYEGLVILAKNTQDAYEQIEPADLAALEDGVYNGKAGGFICSMDLNVTVKDHRITDISINRQVNGGGKYKAPGMTDRIVQAQSVEVDAVSGATLTSETILVAVNRALTGGLK